MTSDSERILLEPYDYIRKIPGKDIRSKFIDAFNLWLHIPEEKVLVVKDIISQLHNASLLIDDIEDNSQLRRGVPVAHNIFGVASTINCANYVYFLALQLTQSLNSPQATQVFTTELLELHQGQGLDIYWRDHCICPTEDEYRMMVMKKTGGLFRLSIGLMQALSNCTYDFTPLVNELGFFFQVLDDYLNLQSDMYHQNKSFCEDLTEGKFSFPIIHSIRSAPQDSRLLNILKKRTTDIEMKRYAVSLMRDTQSFEYSRKVVRESYDKIVAMIAGFGGNQPLQAAVSDLFSTMTKTATTTTPQS